MVKTFDTGIMERVRGVGGQVMFDPTAMEVLSDWLDFEEEIESFGKSVREEIMRKALEVDPQFTSIKGDRVKAICASRGAKYGMREDGEIAGEFLTNPEPKVDSKTVDKFLETTGGLPDGIYLEERTKSLSLRRVK